LHLCADELQTVAKLSDFCSRPVTACAYRAAMERGSIALDRRGFAGGLMAAAFAGLALHSRHASAAMLAEGQGFGAPIPDPAGILDLPPGFS
jgi:hypothetical protein